MTPERHTQLTLLCVMAALACVVFAGIVGFNTLGQQGQVADNTGDAVVAKKRADDARDLAGRVKKATAKADRKAVRADRRARVLTRIVIQKGIAVRGKNGLRGAAGTVGQRGPRGLQGPAGEPGIAPVGVSGPQGLTGPKGEDGADGERGPKGEDGKDGIAGTAGADGAPGAPGAPGANGAPVGSFTFTDGAGVTYVCSDPEGDNTYGCVPA